MFRLIANLFKFLIGILAVIGVLVIIFITYQVWEIQQRYGVSSNLLGNPLFQMLAGIIFIVFALGFISILIVIMDELTLIRKSLSQKESLVDNNLNIKKSENIQNKDNKKEPSF